MFVMLEKPLITVGVENPPSDLVISVFAVCLA